MKLPLLIALITCVSFAEVAGLSEVGRKRIQKEIANLESSLQAAQANVATADKNIKTIETELQTLVALEGEHREAKKKYEEYLTALKKELKDNEAASRELASIESKAKKTPKAKQDEALKTKLEVTIEEKDQRAKIKTEVQEKIKKATTLLKEVTVSLKEIEGKRGPLNRESATWKAKMAEYKEVAGQLAERKKKFNALLKEPVEKPTKGSKQPS